MNFNEFNINILPEIERIIGIEVMDKERLYAALLSDEYLYINKEYILLANSHKLKKLGDSLLNLIKIEYIYRNITVDFNTLALIDTGTKKKIRNNIKFHLDIIDTLIKQGDKHKYNTDSYEILKTLLGVMYLEGNYESTKKIITKDVARVVDDFVINPKYDWYSIIKDWGTDNHAWIDYDIVEKEPFDNSGKIKMELNIFDKKEIGYGDSIREARIDSAYNYYKRYISEEDVKRYIPELKFENFKISGGRLPLLRKSDLEKITSIEVEDYWMLNECFVHESYIEENENSRYKSNQTLSYLGNSVRYFIVDRFVYNNRIIFNNHFNKDGKNVSSDVKKGILNKKVNIDLFKKLNLNDYVLMSDISKESYGIVNSMAKHTINAILGMIFTFNSELNNKFNEIYIEHIKLYLLEIEKKIEPIDEQEEYEHGITKNSDFINPDAEIYSYLLNANVSTPFVILNGEYSLNKQINYLAKEIDIKNIYIASGFVYKSGLTLLQDTIDTIHESDGNAEIIIGSLQKYNKYKYRNNNNIVMGMDKSTANYLNLLIKERNIRVKTFEKSFYHGKYFMLEGKERSCFIIGSSNVSQTAFNMNRELNLIYTTNNNSDEYNYFKQWYDNFELESIQLEELDESLFNDSEVYYINNYSISTIKEKELRTQINELTDEEIKFRMNLWISKKPDFVYTELGIENLEGYYLFEYKKYDLLVLESFEAQNAFYCFKNWSIEELLFRVKHLSKTEIFEISSMSKRGYHISDRYKLETNINMYFVKSYS